MKETVSNPKLVAYCGLYCGACRKYLKSSCPGCHDNGKAAWCKLRSCCMVENYSSCADCTEFQDPDDCRKFNNIISKVFGLIFRSDRGACIGKIREVGIEAYADFMAGQKLQSLRK